MLAYTCMTTYIWRGYVGIKQIYLKVLYTTEVDHYTRVERQFSLYFSRLNAVLHITFAPSIPFNRSFMHAFLFRFFGYPITLHLPATLEASKESMKIALKASLEYYATLHGLSKVHCCVVICLCYYPFLCTYEDELPARKGYIM